MPVRLTTRSGPREVTRQLSFEFGEEVRDLPHVEATQDRLLRFVVEQEANSRLNAELGRMLASRQPLAGCPRHRHRVTALVLTVADDNLEFERVALAGAPDLDRPDLLSPRARLPGALRRITHGPLPHFR